MLKNIRKYAFLPMAAVLILGASETRLYAESELLGRTANAEFSTVSEPELLAAARSAETSPFDFMLLCKRLQVYGSPSAAAAVASQLGIPEKSHSARMTLEIMPCPEALQELRKAAGTVKDPILLAGIFNSLGMRQDSESIELLLPYLGNENSALSSAAAFALGQIGAPKYLTQFQDFIEKAAQSKEYLRLKDALDAGLLYGENLRENQFLAEAEKAFWLVEKNAERDFHRSAAYFQVLLNNDAQTPSRMAEWLTGDDSLKCESALRAAHFLKSPQIADVLISAYAKVSDERKAAILETFSSQKDSRAQGVLLQAIASENPLVAEAGMRAIQGFSDGVGFSELFQTALKAASPELRSSTIQVLTFLPVSANMEILKKLESSDANEIQLAVELCELRKIDAALPAIRNLAKSGNPAAMKALGAVAEMNDVPEIIAGTLSADPALAEASQTALASACALIKDKAGMTALIADGIAKTKGKKAERLYLCQMLNIVGGKEVLEYLRKAALTADDLELQDVAVNVLGRTLDPSAADLLIELANRENQPFGNRALRGYLRIARQFPMANWKRIEIIQNALACPVCTDAEKETVKIIQKQYKIAENAVLNEEQKILSQIKIESAVYGIEEPGKSVDVTEFMQRQVTQTETLDFVLPTRWNDLFGDPAPNVRKMMKIKVSFTSGETKEVTISEGGTIRLPKP